MGNAFSSPAAGLLIILVLVAVVTYLTWQFSRHEKLVFSLQEQADELEASLAEVEYEVRTVAHSWSEFKAKAALADLWKKRSDGQGAGTQTPVSEEGNDSQECNESDMQGDSDVEDMTGTDDEEEEDAQTTPFSTGPSLLPQNLAATVMAAMNKAAASTFVAQGPAQIPMARVIIASPQALQKPQIPETVIEEVQDLERETET